MIVPEINLKKHSIMSLVASQLKMHWLNLTSNVHVFSFLYLHSDGSCYRQVTHVVRLRLFCRSCPIYRHKLLGFETNWVKQVFNLYMNDPKIKKMGRNRDLMASALVSRSSGPGLSPFQGHCVALSDSQGRHLSITVPLSTQVYK